MYATSYLYIANNANSVRKSLEYIKLILTRHPCSLENQAKQNTIFNYTVQKEYFTFCIMLLSESSYFSDKNYFSDSELDETFKELNQGEKLLAC